MRADYAIVGTVSNLSGTGLVLGEQSGANAEVGTDGTFAFPALFVDGQEFVVSVLTHPSGPTQLCTVIDGTGVIRASDASVSVNCVAASRVGGAVSGLSSGQLLLTNAATSLTDTLSINTNGAFSFRIPVLSGEDYEVRVSAHPTTQSCTVDSDSDLRAVATGVAGTGDRLDIQIRCEDNVIATVPNTLILDQESELVLSFNREMNPDSLSLSGGMAARAAAQWSSATLPNDTLTVSPEPDWGVRGSSDLVVAVQNIVSQQLSASFDYDVLPGPVVYLSTEV
ncbi:MAG: hypothetical protein AAFQ82_26565, partial [Myxococcota bacterium]